MRYDFASLPMNTPVLPFEDDGQGDLFEATDPPFNDYPPSQPPGLTWQAIDQNTPRDCDILVTQKGTRRRAIARWAPEVAAPSCGGWWLMLSGATWAPTHWVHMPVPLLAMVASGCFMCLFRA